MSIEIQYIESSDQINLIPWVLFGKGRAWYSLLEFASIIFQDSSEFEHLFESIIMVVFANHLKSLNRESALSEFC